MIKYKQGHSHKTNITFCPKPIVQHAVGTVLVVIFVLLPCSLHAFQQQFLLHRVSWGSPCLLLRPGQLLDCRNHYHHYHHPRSSSLLSCSSSWPTYSTLSSRCRLSLSSRAQLLRFQAIGVTGCGRPGSVECASTTTTSVDNGMDSTGMAQDFQHEMAGLCDMMKELEYEIARATQDNVMMTTATTATPIKTREYITTAALRAYYHRAMSSIPRMTQIQQELEDLDKALTDLEQLHHKRSSSWSSSTSHSHHHNDDSSKTTTSSISSSSSGSSSSNRNHHGVSHEQQLLEQKKRDKFPFFFADSTTQEISEQEDDDDENTTRKNEIDPGKLSVMIRARKFLQSLNRMSTQTITTTTATTEQAVTVVVTPQDSGNNNINKDHKSTETEPTSHEKEVVHMAVTASPVPPAAVVDHNDDDDDDNNNKMKDTLVESLKQRTHWNDCSNGLPPIQQAINNNDDMVQNNAQDHPINKVLPINSSPTDLTMVDELLEQHESGTELNLFNHHQPDSSLSLLSSNNHTKTTTTTTAVTATKKYFSLPSPPFKDVIAVNPTDPLQHHHQKQQELPHTRVTSSSSSSSMTTPPKTTTTKRAIASCVQGGNNGMLTSSSSFVNHRETSPFHTRTVSVQSSTGPPSPPKDNPHLAVTPIAVTTRQQQQQRRRPQTVQQVATSNKWSRPRGGGGGGQATLGMVTATGTVVPPRTIPTKQQDTTVGVLGMESDDATKTTTTMTTTTTTIRQKPPQQHILRRYVSKPYGGFKT